MQDGPHNVHDRIRKHHSATRSMLIARAAKTAFNAWVSYRPFEKRYHETQNILQFRICPCPMAGYGTFQDFAVRRSKLSCRASAKWVDY